MRILLPVSGLLHLSLVLAWGQGMQAYKDHLEDDVLQKARSLKEMKKSIDGPSAPAPMRLMAGGYRSTGADVSIPAPGEGGARYEQMKREPLKLSVVTPNGLVPLTTYQDPNWQSTQASEAAKRAQEEKGGIGQMVESQIKAWHINLFDRNARMEGGEAQSPRPEPPGGSNGPNAGGARSGAPSAEVVAIVEETPSSVEGGQPERKILGFLPATRNKSSGESPPAVYRGLQAYRQYRQHQQQTGADAPEPTKVGQQAKPEKTAPPGEEVASTPPPGEKVTPESQNVGRRSKPGEEAFTEGDVIAPNVPEKQKSLLSRWFNRKGTEDLVVTGEEMNLKPASADRQSNFLSGWFAAARGQESSPAEVKPARTGSERKRDLKALDKAEYLATDSPRAPFHVIDSGPGETYVMELPQGTVGRRGHGSGDQWAWMQLDSGLTGLMRKQYLRPATEPEIQGFQTAEKSPKKSPGALAKKGQQEGGAVASREAEPQAPGEMRDEPAASRTGADTPVPAGLVTPAVGDKKPKPLSAPVEQVMKSLE
jgi:hypothetical protein